MRRLGLILIGATLALGCARSSVVQTARDGDLASLKREIRDAQASGELDRGRVEELAEVIAGREVRSAKGELAVDRIRSARACLGPLTAVLEDRASKTDDPGAEAMLALVDAGLVKRRRLVKQYAETSSGPWRAVAARAAATTRDGPVRRALITDPDERVRRAALRAAAEARDPADVEDLLEAARLDPDPMSKSLAARAAGAVGGERAVLGLKDLWARADQQTRITIVDAWAMPGAWGTGGERELVWVAETTSSLPALAAADALVRAGGETADIGVGVLGRSVKDGTWTERTLAIRLAPIDGPGVLDALVEAAKDDNEDVQVVALARLAAHPEHGEKSTAALRKIAKGKDDRARRARAALAAARDQAVMKLLEQDLKSASPGERIAAAVGLVRLGNYSSAASALADDNPRVRMQVACSVLAARSAR